VNRGAKSPYTGIFVALRHGLVEIPLVILISYDFGEIFNLSFLKKVKIFFSF